MAEFEKVFFQERNLQADINIFTFETPLCSVHAVRQMSGHLINGDVNDGSWPAKLFPLLPLRLKDEVADDDGVHKFCKVDSSFAQLFN